MFRGFIKLLLVLLVGGIGGILLERTFIPWLAQREPFSRIPSLTIERVTVVEPMTQIIIDEAQALERAVGAAQSQLVAVERQNARGAVLDSASGLVWTSDGIVVTSTEVIAPGGTYTVYREREQFDAELIASDETVGIALLRVNATRWPVAAPGEPRDRVLGKRIFVLSQEHQEDLGDLATTLTPGIVAQVLSDGTLAVDIPLEEMLPGSAVFTLEGRLLGILHEGEIVDVSEIEHLFNGTEFRKQDFSASFFR